MEPDLVGLGRAVAAALLGPDVDDRRAGQVERPAERLEQGMEVVARHDADVGDAEILEQLAGLGEAGRPTCAAAGSARGRCAPTTGIRSTVRS